MNCKQLSLVLSLTCGLTTASSALAADAPKLQFPAPSPSCTLKQHVGLTDIEVDYSRPGVKGRAIFGSMLPYGKVWRTGANSATKVIFSTPVKLNGSDVPAGTYALMTIPDKGEWTIIVNKGAEQWGAYKYDEKDDVVRFKAKAIALKKPVETFTIDFSNIKDDSANLDLTWDKVTVPINVTVDYAPTLTKEIQAEMASDDAKKPYFQAAKFYYDHGLDLQQASKWIDAAIADHEAHYIVYVKAEILQKLGDKQGALAAAKRSKELAEKANDTGYVKLNEILIAKLK
ncbi:MAG TPA: DUF2911 domain-containing protein [Trichormus sp.]|jgi:hypothetical protein